jgi:glyoxylase-like metal-dependent hydrolase (beta-lactamase superfamily II)
LDDLTGKNELPAGRLPEIEAERLERELIAGEEFVIVDVRPREAFRDWSIDPVESAVMNVPLAELDASLTRVREAAAGRPIRVICAAGNSSARATETLVSAGLPAENVAGGMVAWSRILTADEIPSDGPETIMQFRREARGCLSYLVVSGEEALVVDPAPDVRPYIEEADRHGARITTVFDTHIHADHVSGAPFLRHLPGVTYCLGKESVARGLRPIDGHFRLVRDGDLVDFGKTAAKVVALPGHTSEMSGLLLDRSLFCGDTLFADGVARPDLEDCSHAVTRAAASILWRTLKSVVLRLPVDTQVLSCHYPGGRIGSPISPTLEEVIRDVPQLEWSEAEFVDWLVGSLPDRPANYSQLIEANLGLSSLSDLDLGRLETGANSCASR